MARPSGRRNEDYEEKRSALIDRLTRFVLDEGVNLPSLRQLAIAADTSQPTLNHYFGNRTGIIIAIIERMARMSAPLRDQMKRPAGTLEESLADYARLAGRLSSRKSYMNAHIFAIREGMNNPEVFKANDEGLLQTAIDALAERLVKSEGGPVNCAQAQVAGRMMMACAMMDALRNMLNGSRDAASIDTSDYPTMLNWLAHGVIRDPNARRTPQAAK